MSPTVSVVIAAYQAAEFVGDAIGSALAQTLPDIEVVVVDDCSSDATWAVLNDWAARDPRVRPMRQPRRSGPGAARNAGISARAGKLDRHPRRRRPLPARAAGAAGRQGGGARGPT
jgi:glycosyltransferase involved in cell wall biosynthesis